MQFRTTFTSILFIGVSHVTATNVCRPNEIAIGVTSVCQLGNELQGPGNCVATPTMWSDGCITLDSAPNGDTEICTPDGGWSKGSVVNCVPHESGDKVWNIRFDGQRFGSQPDNASAGCYKSGQFCADVPLGYAEVQWCCPRV